MQFRKAAWREPGRIGPDPREERHWLSSLQDLQGTMMLSLGHTQASCGLDCTAADSLLLSHEATFIRTLWKARRKGPGFPPTTHMFSPSHGQSNHDLPRKGRPSIYWVHLSELCSTGPFAGSRATHWRLNDNEKIFRRTGRHRQTDRQTHMRKEEERERFLKNKQFWGKRVAKGPH